MYEDRFCCTVFFINGHLLWPVRQHTSQNLIEKRPFLSDFYRNKLKIRDESFAGKKEIIDGLRAFGKKNNDASLVTEADYAEAWLQLLQSPDKKMQTGSMLRFIQNCIDDKDYLNAARANRTLGELY